MRVCSRAIVFAVCAVGCAGTIGDNSLNGSQSAFQHDMLEEELGRLGETPVTVPESSEGYYEFILAELAFNNERSDEAIEHYMKAAEVETSPAPYLRTRLAQLYIRDNKLDEALEEIERALKGASDDVELRQLHAGVLAALQRSDDAAAEYEGLIVAEPEKEELYLLLASLYAQSGKLDNALAVLDRLRKINADSVFAAYYSARIYAAQGENEKALSNFKRALEIEPNAETVALDYARFLGKLDRVDEGIAVCERYLAVNPGSIGARQLRAQFLLYVNKLDEALEDYQEIGKRQNDPAEVLFKIALIKLERHDVDGAINDFNLVLAKSPDFTNAHYYLATAYASADRPKDALDHLEKIEESDQLFVQARTYAAFLLQKLGRYPEAIKQIDDALDKQEKDPRLLRYLASLQRDAKRMKDALNTIQKLIEIEPSTDEHYFTLGVYYDEAGDDSRARSAMEKAIELNAENANALNYLGYSLAEGNENLSRAEELIRRAVALEPENGYFLDSLGWVYYKGGDFEKALAELRKAVQFTPDDAVILEHLGLALLKSNKRQEALEVFRRSLHYAPDAEEKEELIPRLESVIKTLSQEFPDVRKEILPPGSIAAEK